MVISHYPVYWKTNAHIHILAATKRSSMNGSFCPSVRLSVTHFNCVPIIMSSWNFQECLIMTEVMSMQRVKVIEVKPHLNRFRTITPVWIHIRWWNNAQRWCCLGEVPYCFSRSSVKFQGHTAKKIVDFDPNWAFPDYNSSLKSPMSTKRCTKLEVV